MNLSLRTKGVIALSVLILYIASISWLLALARQELYVLVQQIEANFSKQALLVPVFKTLSHSLVETQAILSSPEKGNHALAYRQVLASIEPIQASLDQAQKMYPLLAQTVAGLQDAIAAVRAQPHARHLAMMRNSEQELLAKLNDILTALQERTAEFAQSYHNRQQLMNVITISANIVGVGASVAVILVFFTRLAKDVKRLQDRAEAVVAGYAGEPLVKNRTDEIGGLIDAVNRMQVDLRRWEQQQEITRQQRMHQEKMAAVGSLAAAIGHEVSNPIAAISGVAQAMIDETKDDPGKTCKVLHDFAVLIYKQAERIALIMRQMATLTTPHSPDPELLDLNALIRSTCGFVCYDKRFSGIEFDFDLDRDLPALTAVADHITQILMNLLINAADAMDQPAAAGRQRILISTRLVGAEVKVMVVDSGHGMSPAVLKKAFQESFSTKPAGKGRGIGLFLCKTLVESGGGRIELISERGVGTTANLFLPLSTDDKVTG